MEHRVKQVFAGGIELPAEVGQVIHSGIPGTPIETLYQLDGILYFNGQAYQPRHKVELVTGTIALSNAQTIILINSATNCNIFLPIGVNDQVYRVRNIGAGLATFIPNGSNTVENAGSYQLKLTNAFDLVFYANNWYIL